MKVSKSLMPFGHKAEDTEYEPLGRPRGRSSLDTFIIPGRTRFPSSKLSPPEPVDLQITHGLLNPDAFKVPKMTANRVDIPKSWFTSEHAPVCGVSPKSHRHHRVSGKSIVVVAPSPKRRPKKPSKTSSKLDTGEAVVSPTLHDRSEDSQSPLFHCRLTSRSSEQALNPFDGPFDSGPESLPTSGTWTTVSNRIFTDSSVGSSSRDVQRFVDEYNRLALKHGLPRFTEAPVPVDMAKDTETDVKITSKSHNNWLMRKILRRSSSTYNVKVKSANKRVVRKLSVSSISERSRKDILKDKSLEEIGRLSGLSILVLPSEFAVDKLTLPTCLSATATYLSQHGRTTPGVFRVPGQQNTVNALYDYYAHQYSSADSISDQVQQTVGSGLLPTHIPHSVHDVASVFKKLIAGLSGGLLGSILLFKALRSISDYLHPSPELPDPQHIKIRARLIALAISSVTSALRVSLIWAVLGLAALIGHEADKAEQADKVAGKDGEQHRRVSFELMGYRSLGVVLGPLLLGDLTDQIVGSDENERGGLLVLPDTTKKRRKEKKKEKDDDKLEQSSALIAHVDRANVTARVMEMLIESWQEVVKQLRNIHAPGNGGLLATSESRQRLVSANSRLTMQASEEELLFDFLRGRPSTGDFKGSMKIKKRVKISSGSPSSHHAIWATDSSQGSRHSKRQRGLVNKKNVVNHTVSKVHEIEDVGDAERTSQQIRQGESPKLVTYSALASAGKDGLILQHPFTGQSLECNTIRESHENPAELIDTHASLQPSTYQFINGHPLPQADLPNATTTQVPIAASRPEIEAARIEDQGEEQAREQQYKIAASQPETEAAMIEYQGEEQAPEQQHTIDASQPEIEAAKIGHHGDRHAPEQQHTHQYPMPSMTMGHPQPRPAQEPHVDTALSEQNLADNAGSPSSAATNPIAEEPRLPAPTRHNSVRQLAQLFGTGPPFPQRKGRSLDIGPFRSQAPTRHLSADHSTRAPASPTALRWPLQLHDASPTIDKPATHSAHASLIPKPILDLGRGRQPLSRSPSPSRSPNAYFPPTLPSNCASTFSIHPDPSDPSNPEPDLPQPSSHSLSPTRPIHPSTPLRDTPARRVNSMGPLRCCSDAFSAPKLVPLSPHARVALSTESLRRMQLALAVAEPAVAQRVSSSRSPASSHGRSATTGNLDLAAYSSAQLAPPSPHAHVGVSAAAAATNATLHASIRRLQRQVEQKCEEATQARRSLDAVREAREGGMGSLSEELREARRELRMWRRRAEWAEARLLGLGMPVVEGDEGKGKREGEGEVGDGEVEVEGS